MELNSNGGNGGKFGTGAIFKPLEGKGFLQKEGIETVSCGCMKKKEGRARRGSSPHGGENTVLSRDKRGGSRKNARSRVTPGISNQGRSEKKSWAGNLAKIGGGGSRKPGGEQNFPELKKQKNP